MVRHLIILTVGCFLIFCCGLAKSDETVANEIKKREQLYTDVFFLKKGIEELQSDVEILNKRSDSQISMLKTIKSQAENQDSTDGICERVSTFFNSTYRKYNMFEERILTKLDEIHEDQTINLNKILVKQNLSKNSQQASALDIMSTALGEIGEKIDEFEIQLRTFESLEQKLMDQQTKLDNFHEVQLKMLKEINDKLTQNQLKFDAFEKQIPNLKQLTEGLGQVSSQKKARLPMDIILGLTQNQAKPPK